MSFSRTPLLASRGAAAVLTAGGGDGGSFYLTLDGKQPQVIAHRGVSG
jgi:glycerophosphoryl diester phosphodiesterase